jgi:hypothetical protein
MLMMSIGGMCSLKGCLRNKKEETLSVEVTVVVVVVIALM